MSAQPSWSTSAIATASRPGVDGRVRGDLLELARTHEEVVDRAHPGGQAVHGLADEHVEATVAVEVAERRRLDARHTVRTLFVKYVGI